MAKNERNKSKPAKSKPGKKAKIDPLENTKLKKENANLISDHEIIAQLSDRIIHLEDRLNEK